jgi:hypothetical protein
VGVQFGSGGSGWIGLQPAAGVAGDDAPAAASARGSLELFENDASGIKSTQAWVWNGLRDMRNAPRALVGLGEVRGHGCDGGGGFARRSSPACVF